MPRYLRWLAAMSSGVSAYFAYAILTLGLTRASGRETIGGAAAGLLSLGAGVVMMIAALAVNDWLIKRYPPGMRSSADEQREQEPADRP